VSGQLNSFDFEPGQTLLKNQNAGRIDDLSEYIITCMVDQHYLPRVRENLQAHIESDKQSYSLYISKVLPTVVNGQFEIKLSFNDSLPVHLRRGQIFQVLIQISARKKVVMIPKGSYYQSSGGKFLYVLSRDEKRAVKREVRLGTQNQSHYEVISGLDEGDRFISSSYEVFEQSELIEIVK
jgi:HlyD family secretion protein